MGSDSPGKDTLYQQLGKSDKQPSFWRRYRWAVIVVVIIILAGGIALALRSGNNNQASTVSTAASTSNSSQTNPNTWKGTVNETAIPLGDGNVSTTPKVGYVDSCVTNFPRSGGAQHSGNWINQAQDTWNAKAKISVEGSVSWPSAHYTESTSGSSRILTTNDLPEGYTTGNFPITRSDPAYQYDTNPNHIAAQNVNYSLPLNPAAAGTPSCLGLGPIGVLSDGVLLYDALDDSGRDAVAHEIQDSCDGHPDGQDRYHYHDVSSCILSHAAGSSTLVGYALDGYGIYAERDRNGNLPTNADLDACHGRTSPVVWNGKLTTIYHYDATLEYPYTVGCYHGTPITTASSNASSSTSSRLAPRKTVRQ